MSDKPNNDPPRKAHDANRLGGEDPPFYAAAAALDDLDADLTAHSDATGGVHGVAESDTVAGQADVDDVTADLNDHEASSSGVHGVGGSNVESEAGAQSKVNDHENKSNPHGNVTSVNGASGDVTVEQPAATDAASIAGGLSPPTEAVFDDGSSADSIKESSGSENIPTEGYIDATWPETFADALFIDMRVSGISDDSRENEIIDQQTGEVLETMFLDPDGENEFTDTISIPARNYTTIRFETVEDDLDRDTELSLTELNEIPLPDHSHQI